MEEITCPGCDEVLTELDLMGVTAEIAYDSDGDRWHQDCYDNYRYGD